MSFLDDYNNFNGFEGMNKQQISAILDSFDEQYHTFFVLAGAGSGKTRVLITRTEYLIKEMNVNPSSIMAITFTNKAANELLNRVSKVTCYADDMTVGTYHHVCNKLLKLFGEEIGIEGFTILDPRSAKNRATKILVEMGVETSKDLVKKYLSKVSDLKSELINHSKHREDMMKKYKADSEKFRNDPEYEFVEFYSKFQAENTKNRELDYDDMIMYTIFLLQRSENARAYVDTFEYIMADEVQDSNWSNIVLLHELSNGRNLFIVGDMDQSIYKFRNARPEFFINMKNNPKVNIFKLERNYRSTGNIVNASNKIIEHNKGRLKKTCFTEKEDGEKIQCFITQDSTEEASLVACNIQTLVSSGYDFKDIMLLYRTKAQSRAFEDMFLQMEIPYVLVGMTSFTDREEIRNCMCYLRVASNPRDKYSFERALSLLDGIGEKTTESIMKIFDKKGNAKDTLEYALTKSTKTRVQNSLTFFIDLLKLSNDKPTAMLRKIADILIEKLMKVGTEEAFGKIENIEELLKIATEKENAGVMIKEFVGQMDLLSKRDIGAETNAVQMLTIHSSKGLESKVVFLVGVNEELLPHTRSSIDEVIEEERRCMYVACTRAEELLYISSYKNNGEKECVPSRFIDEIPENCIDIMEV